MEVALHRLLGTAPAGADRHRGEPGPVAAKVAVIGNTGSGKTTFARRLAESLSVPHVELDALHWGPGWTQATAEELRGRVDAALTADGWVVDGNYLGKIGTRVLEQADVVVWLDPPLPTILRRLWRRTLRRIRAKEELWSGNVEGWRGAFLSRESIFWWAVKMHVRRRRTWPRLLERFDVVRLRSAVEADAWLARYVQSATP